MKPTWWLRYIIGLSLVGLLGLVEISGPRGGLQSVLEIIVVIGSFVLMALPPSTRACSQCSITSWAGCRSWDTNSRLIGMLTEGDLIARRIRGAPDAGGRSCSEDATTPTS